MAVFALCNICSRPAFFTCSACGKSVCGHHYNSKSGLCTDCEGGRLVELPPPPV
ncbi:MAG: orotate phosphoribosyltransferase [Candidatus Thermoplasmatota archaeon]